MSRELSPINERFVVEALAEGRFPSREALLDRAVDALRLALAHEPVVDPELAHPIDSRTIEAHSTEVHVTEVQAIDDCSSRVFEGWDSDVWDSDAVMRRIFERLAEAGVRTND